MNGRPLRVYTRAELDTLPDPQWLVHDFIQTESSVVLFGDAGIGKTFVVLDLSLCIATGTPWHGRSVRRGSVVYLSPEGRSGLKLRVAAWETKYGANADDFFLIADGPQLHDKNDQKRLLDAIAGLPAAPALVVIDTLARHFVGGGENDSKEMGMLIAALEAVRKQFGCSSVLVHHTSKGTNDLRGSGSLRGSADTIVLAKEVQKSVIELSCEKQKESSEFAIVRFRRQPVSIPRADGSAATSCVMEPAPQHTSTLAMLKGQLVSEESTQLKKNPDSILRAFASTGTTSLRKAQIAAESGVPEGSLGRNLDRLVQDELLEKEDHGLYRLTDHGKTVVDAMVRDTMKNISDRSNIDRDRMGIDHHHTPP